MTVMAEADRERFLETLRSDVAFRATVRRELLTQELLDLPQTAAEMQRQMVEMRGDFAEMQRQMVEMRADITELQRQLVEMRADITELQRQLVEMRADIAEMQRQMVEMRADITEMQRQMVEMRGDFAEMQRQIMELQEEVRSIRGDMRTLIEMMHRSLEVTLRGFENVRDEIAGHKQDTAAGFAAVGARLDQLEAAIADRGGGSRP